MRELFLRRARERGWDEELDRKLVGLVLHHARAIIAHPVRPRERTLLPFVGSPLGELALDESIDEDPRLQDVEHLVVEETRDKRFPCVAMLDCSFSMSGEKHLLSSIAAAVMVMHVPPEDTSLVVFGSSVKALKRLGETVPAGRTVLEFLRVRPGGFTNIASALQAGLSEMGGRRSRRRRVGIIATDGRPTEGDDPFELAKRYDYLAVLHLHGAGSSLEASQALAASGHGRCFDVERFEDLPRRLYDALREIGRL